MAVDYSASNVILIQGDGGAIIVDAATDPVAARAIRAAFGDRLHPPVRAIIYTHSHGDHTGGASVFARTDHPEIISHSPFGTLADIGRAGRDGGDLSAFRSARVRRLVQIVLRRAIRIGQHVARFTAIDPYATNNRIELPELVSCGTVRPSTGPSPT